MNWISHYEDQENKLPSTCGLSMLKASLLVEIRYLEWQQPGVKGRCEPAGKTQGDWWISQ